MPVSAPAIELPALAQQYQLRGAEDVEAYLEEYPFLFPLLFEAVSPIERIFGKDARRVIEVAADPEAESGRGKLYLLIQTRDNVEDALAKQDQLDHEWWLSAFSRACCRMNVDVEFV